jgi:hypothetical protein
MTETDRYHFISRWSVEGTIREVMEVLLDLAALPRWWPSVYLDVQGIEPGDGPGVRHARMLARGWLPYTIRWEFDLVECRYPHGFTIAARGDLEGRGVWSFEQAGDRVLITYDWNIRARKPLIKNLSFVMKPLFAANHRWAMAQGETSLRLELERRRATSQAARAAVPGPPRPATHAAAIVAVGIVAAAAAAAYLIGRARQNSHRARRRPETRLAK